MQSRIFFLLLPILCLQSGGKIAFAEPNQVDVVGLTSNAVVSDPVNIDASARSGMQILPIYLRLHFSTESLAAWGISIYTTNQVSAGNPTDGIYGGLRGMNDASQRIPLYWQVYNSLQGDTLGSPLTISSSNLYQWGRIYDRDDFDVKVAWDSADVLGRRTVVNYKNLGAYPSSNRAWNTSPVYLYLGMEVGAVSSQIFKANINIDFYNLGISLDKGGYATPNPFTPHTGQKTNFNFTLATATSTAIVRIYTLRGRLIRTLVNLREWDGRNETGGLVEGGLYIYQIEADQTRVSGTVVVLQ